MKKSSPKQNNRLTALLVILPVLASGGLGTWYALKHPIKKDRKTIAEQFSNGPLYEPSKQDYRPLIDETKSAPEQNGPPETVPSYARDWNKFVSPSYGFSFRFPSSATEKNATAKTECNIPLAVKDNTAALRGSTSDNGYEFVYGNFFKVVGQGTNGRVLSDMLKNNDIASAGYEISKMTFPGAAEAVTASKKSSQNVSDLLYLVRDSENIYFISGYQDPLSKDCVPDYETTEQIIRTLSFK